MEILIIWYTKRFDEMISTAWILKQENIRSITSHKRDTTNMFLEGVSVLFQKNNWELLDFYKKKVKHDNKKYFPMVLN